VDPVPAVVSPGYGPLPGATLVQINGTGFVNTSLLLVEFRADTLYANVSATFVSANRIDCFTPAFSTAGVVNVTVMPNGQQAAASQPTYRYYSAWRDCALSARAS
jgi:hypothetical protein